MYRKKLSIILAVALASTSFVGCAKKSDSAAEEASEIIETIDVGDVVSDSGAEVSSVEGSAGAAGETGNANFDPSVYANLDMNMGTLTDAAKVTINGYYGSLNIQAADSTMYLSVEYNLEHIAEIQDSEVTEDNGSLMELYSGIDGKLYLNDTTMDKNNPKKIYFADSSSEGSSEEPSSIDVGDTFTLKGIMGEDVSYVGYRNETVIDGRTVDICDITLTDESGKIVPCCAYIDRTTKTIQKIEKEANSTDEYSMVIEPLMEGINEPSWISECVEASDEDAMDMFALVMVMGLIMSDKDGGSGITVSDIPTYDIPEEQRDMMDEKMKDEHYWEERIGSYSGYMSINGQVTVYDDDNKEYYFRWDSDLMDFVETESGITSETTYETGPSVTSNPAMIDEPPVTLDENASRAGKNTQEQAAKATTMDEKRRSFAYWKEKLGGYTGQSANETGTQVTVYDGNGFAHSFTWSESSNDYIER